MKNSVCSLLLTLLCIVLAVLVAVFGIRSLGLGGVFEENTINKGLDLVGGSSITLKAIPDPDSDITLADAMDKAVDILERRLTKLNYTEATVTKVGNDQIRIEIPGIDNPEDALRTLGSTAKLTFVDSDGNVVIEGKDVKNAAALYDKVGELGGYEHYVALEFNADAQAAFADATERMAAKEATGENYIEIRLDADIISSPRVTSKIDSTNCQITGNFTEKDAKELAALISSGQLPVSFEEDEVRSVGATLGGNALSSSLIAGAIGILLVMVFMIIIYRLPGFISAIALVAYTALFGIILALTRINLSLPGIAGIILTIGMAVDANVVIYERIKEELRTGKTLRAAVKAGFSRAFSAILDSNVTTLIAAVVLWIYGTGTVQGFAQTLFVGVLLSMFTALVITRVLLYAFVDLKASPVLFGAPAKKSDN